MQIKNVIIDNIHYIKFITFNISTLFHYDFFLICPAELGVGLIHLCILYAIKYGTYFKQRRNMGVYG